MQRRKCADVQMCRGRGGAGGAEVLSEVQWYRGTDVVVQVVQM